MKVGILGSGIVGRTLGAGFIKHGHQAMLGTRDADKKDMQQWIRETPGAAVGTFEVAAKFGELIVLATLGRVVESVIKQAGAANFAGKTVMDATNPLADAPPINGVLPYFTGPNESLGERIQAILPDAHVVKAFNSVGNARMINPQYTQGVPTMFLCGNSKEAKNQVSEVIRQFGWEPFDCGSITAARAIEPLCMLWCIPGFLNNEWGHAFKLLQK
ncbi:MAG: NAD(P)-binding domain-containing protein [Acidobacteriota bacterium]|nr:NAD(P)-binding domain-containing protein [Acidobacteriota bacterium]